MQHSAAMVPRLRVRAPSKVRGIRFQHSSRAPETSNPRRSPNLPTVLLFDAPLSLSAHRCLSSVSSGTRRLGCAGAGPRLAPSPSCLTSTTASARLLSDLAICFSVLSPGGFIATRQPCPAARSCQSPISGSGALFRAGALASALHPLSMCRQRLCRAARASRQKRVLCRVWHLLFHLYVAALCALRHKSSQVDWCSSCGTAFPKGPQECPYAAPPSTSYQTFTNTLLQD
jgi:hypothetical protein